MAYQTASRLSLALTLAISGCAGEPTSAPQAAARVVQAKVTAGTGQLVWSAFECSVYALMIKDDAQSERLF